MGFNTTVVVMNDALGEIMRDHDFGSRLATAIINFKPDSRNYVAAHGPHGIHCNAAEIIETHHADYDVKVIVGGNTGKVDRA